METNKILIIDDEPGTLFAFKRVLEDPVLEIDTTPTIEEAIKLIDKRTYHAIITDLSLTGTGEMEGYEVIRHTKIAQPKTKVIIITAHGGEEEKAKVIGMGAFSFLEKPVSPSAIKQLLRSIGTYSLEERFA
jgi:two-component system, NtrC family, response regulator HydG